MVRRSRWTDPDRERPVARRSRRHGHKYWSERPGRVRAAAPQFVRRGWRSLYVFSLIPTFIEMDPVQRRIVLAKYVLQQAVTWTEPRTDCEMTNELAQIQLHW